MYTPSSNTKKEEEEEREAEGLVSCQCKHAQYDCATNDVSNNSRNSGSIVKIFTTFINVSFIFFFAISSNSDHILTGEKVMAF